MDELKAIDLCCGAGGWATAARGLPIKWVAVADWDEGCLETWEVNHGQDHPDCEVIRADLSTEEGIDSLGGLNADIIVGGIPCEQVSVLRAAPASDETMADWHRLIDRVLGFIKATSPRFWCFEDIIQIERHLFPLLAGIPINIHRIQASDYQSQSRIRTFFGKFPRPRRGKPSTLRDHLRPGPHLIVSGADSYERVEALNGRMELGSDRIRVLSPDRPSPTITGSIGLRGGRNKREFAVVDDRNRARQLSWQEAASIQGFPDDYLFVGGFTAAQKMIGRAIPIGVGRAILNEMVKESAHARA